MAEPFRLDPDPAFAEDLEAIDPFYLGAIHRNISWCPAATSVVRVGDFRILYRVEERTVHLLRLGLKVRERLLPVRIERGGPL